MRPAPQAVEGRLLNRPFKSLAHAWMGKGCSDAMVQKQKSGEQIEIDGGPEVAANVSDERFSKTRQLFLGIRFIDGVILPTKTGRRKRVALHSWTAWMICVPGVAGLKSD